jgi:monoamine oxidase
MKLGELLAPLGQFFRSSPLSAPAGAEAGRASRRADVIVIGGGIAGLACARMLGRSGKQVLLLEGRTRLGGRIHCVPMRGVQVDLGASWIQGRKRNPISELAEQAGARVVRTDYESLELYDIDGRELTDREHGVIDAAVERTMQELLREQRKAGRSDSIEPVVRRALEQHGLSETERRGLRWALASEIASEYGVDFHHLSLSQWDEDYEYGGGDRQFAGGGAMLIDFLARECAGCGVEIRTGAAVRTIDRSPQEVRVVTGEGEYTAPQAVATLPLGVLKSATVELRGGVPQDKQRAIRQLAVGTLNKVVMAFRRRFWEEEAHYFGCLGESGEPHIDYWNLEPVNGAPILAALFCGSAAVRLEAMSDGEVERAALSPLRRVFGARVDEPTALQVTRWTQDPFSRGSYSHVPPGAGYDDYEAMAEPIGGRLFFAGEATNGRYPSTLHGAYESGERAAKDILR